MLDLISVHTIQYVVPVLRLYVAGVTTYIATPCTVSVPTTVKSGYIAVWFFNLPVHGGNRSYIIYFEVNNNTHILPSNYTKVNTGSRSLKRGKA